MHPPERISGRIIVWALVCANDYCYQITKLDKLDVGATSVSNSYPCFPKGQHEALSAQLPRSASEPCQASILFADATKKRKVELPTLILVGFGCSFTAPLQKTNGTILHLPSKACFPNLRSYHSYVPWAVTPRLTATNTNAQATVLLSHLPGGAAMPAMDR